MAGKFRDPTPEPSLSKKQAPTVVRMPVLEIIYGIDKLEIVSKVSPDLLKERFKILSPIKKSLVRYCEIVGLEEQIEKDQRGNKNKRANYADARKQKFLSLVRMVLPSASFFDLLLENESIFGKKYKPWCIEFFKDFVMASATDALRLNEQCIKTSYLNYPVTDLKGIKSHPSKVFKSENIKYMQEQEYKHRIDSHFADSENIKPILSSTLSHYPAPCRA